MKRLLLILPVAFALTACGTLFGPDHDPVTIHSGISNTTFAVNGNEIGQGSAVYNVPRGDTVVITASHPNCADRTVQTGKSFAAISLLDIFFWPTFIVDAVTGKISKTDPTDYTVTPACHAGDDHYEHMSRAQGHPSRMSEDNPDVDRAYQHREYD